uniref:Uncharacterized protein n=1 Tax=Corallina officinalis TaxID=35170 RepID=A0A6M3WDA1_COROI|nr:hypothetical protein [Corallina officinalis]
MIQFLELSNYDQYLYSPKSLLHSDKKDYKIFHFFLQLLLLPFMPFLYILLVLVICILVFILINIPSSVKNSFKNFFLFLLCIMSINLYHITQIRLNNPHILDNSLIKIKPLDLFASFVNITNPLTYKALNFCFYLSLPMLRLFSISIIYLFIVRILLLTTYYEKIINLLIYKIKFLQKIISIEKKFFILLSSQFLKIIFIDLDKIKISYLIRSINYNNYRMIGNSIYIIRYILKNLYKNTNYITYSLYSRAVNSKYLYILNIYDLK